MGFNSVFKGLTDFKHRSHSRQVNGFSASQEMISIFRNPKIQYNFFVSATGAHHKPILILYLSIPMSSKRSLSFAVSKQNAESIGLLRYSLTVTFALRIVPDFIPDTILFDQEHN